MRRLIDQFHSFLSLKGKGTVAKRRANTPAPAIHIAENVLQRRGVFRAVLPGENILSRSAGTASPMPWEHGYTGHSEKCEGFRRFLENSKEETDFSEKIQALQQLKSSILAEMKGYQAMLTQRYQLDDRKSHGEKIEEQDGVYAIPIRDGILRIYTRQVIQERIADFQSILDEVEAEIVRLTKAIQAYEESLPTTLEEVQAEIAALLEGDITIPAYVGRTAESVSHWQAKRGRALLKRQSELQAALTQQMEPLANGHIPGPSDVAES